MCIVSGGQAEQVKRYCYFAVDRAGKVALAANRTIYQTGNYRIPIPKTEDIEKHREEQLLER